MSSHRLPSPVARAARAGVLINAGRAAVVAWGLLLACPAAARAENPVLLDTRHTLLARQALQDDPVLAPLNLGVRVRNGVATLWGPVPSLELGRRAAARLQGLPELAAVRNELFLDPWTGMAGDGQTEPVPPLPLRPREGELPTPAATAATAGRPFPTPFVPSLGSAGLPPASPTNGGAAVPRRAQPLAVMPALRVPVPAPVGPATPADTRASDIASQVRLLRQGEERYRRVRVEVQGGQVYLSGAVPAWRDLHELAAAITRLPGVVGVTIREIRTDPPGR